MRNQSYFIKVCCIFFATIALSACGGGGDTTAPAETTTGGTTGATTSSEPTTGYGYVTNPAGGNFGTQCAKDFATGLIWEGKNPDPSHPQSVGRAFTNFDSTTTLQILVEIPGRPTLYLAPSNADINATSNSIGYKNTINASALCGFTDWRLPTRNELIALGKLSDKLPDFPEVTSGAYWSSANISEDGDDTIGVVVRPPDVAGNKAYRVDRYGVRLVRSSR